ncbi:MAG: NAD(P)H-dependent oxidoreductase [Saprospiraceae bacterium]|nr:NAD(P)H-dependent oxidoreductase [Saprospiraceae bacterium]MCB9322326.1 NAD(P)H-dependent oxidoreductase [Lewinellaceae bacterium]
MITVVSGSNREYNRTLAFAKKYVEILKEMTEEEIVLLDMSEMPFDWMHEAMYSEHQQSESLAGLQDKYITAANKFVFITPEYNGSYPGIVKLFLDACSVRNYDSNFKQKKVALVGVATGRAGNLRGMDHLADALNHMGAITLPNRMPYSSVSGLIDKNGNVVDEATIKTIRKHIAEFVEF